MKGAVLAAARFLVRLFYRRIEIAGLDRVPRDGPVLFVANHNNGLVDPMVVLAALDRPVVFVAKSTLWKIPVLRSLLDLLGCVPVVRKGEEEIEEKISLKGEERNRAAFERLAAELDRSGCILIFPEGRSHSDPRLSEMRTGAARALLLSKKSPVVIPLGLWFTKKEEFRSDVLVTVGPPVVPAPGAPETAVERWTDAIGAALEAVTLNADSWRDHEVVAAVDALYGGSVERRFFEGEEGESQVASAGPLERAMRVRRLLTAARDALEKTHPGEVARVARRALAFSYLLRKFSLTPSALDEPAPASAIVAHTLRALFVVLVGFPVAVLGVLAWWIPYRLCGVVANRVPGGEQKDQISLYKLLAGCVLFPLFLLLWTVAIGLAAGPLWAGAAALFLPFAGISSLLFLEYASWREGQLRDLLALAFAPRAMERLRREREALVAACDRLAEIAAAAADNPAR